MRVATALLETGLAWQITKHTARDSYVQAVDWLEATTDALDARYGKILPCSGDILCERQYRRHKAGCIGRTIPIEQYVRAMG